MRSRIPGVKQLASAPGTPFKRGNCIGKGRPKGSKNKIGKEFKDFCKELVSGGDYQGKLRERVLEGKAGVMEQVVAYYGAGGKPKESVEVAPSESLAKLLLLAAQSRQGGTGDDGAGKG